MLTCPENLKKTPASLYISGSCDVNLIRPILLTSRTRESLIIYYNAVVFVFPQRLH